MRLIQQNSENSRHKSSAEEEQDEDDEEREFVKPDDRFNMERFSRDNDEDEDCGLEVDLEDSDKDSEVVGGVDDNNVTPKITAVPKLQLEGQSKEQYFGNDIESEPVVSGFQVPDQLDEQLLSSRTV